MRAWRVNELGHPSQSLRLEEVADPVPGPGQVMIGVEAGTINFAHDGNLRQRISPK